MPYRCSGTSAKRRRNLEYPDNGAYMIAAYVVTGVIVLAYAVSLFVRTRKFW